jgi:hypothetical protein
MAHVVLNDDPDLPTADVTFWQFRGEFGRRGRPRAGQSGRGKMRCNVGLVIQAGAIIAEGVLWVYQPFTA